MVMWKVVLGAIALVLAVPTVASVAQTSATSNAGTLTCTVEDADVAANRRGLSCSYQPIAGAGASYEGNIEVGAETQLNPAKHVIVWAVLASEPSIDLKSLEGRYVTGRSGNGMSTASRVEPAESEQAAADIMLQRQAVGAEVQEASYTFTLSLSLART